MAFRHAVRLDFCSAYHHASANEGLSESAKADTRQALAAVLGTFAQKVLSPMNIDHQYITITDPEDHKWYAEDSRGFNAWGITEDFEFFFVMDDEEEVENESPILPAQMAAYDFHFENQDRIKGIILDKFIEEYEDLIDFEGGNREELPDSISTREEMAKLLDFSCIWVKKAKGDSGHNLVGYSFESPIDEEHGHGLTLDGDKIVSFGHEEEAW